MKIPIEMSIYMRYLHQHGGMKMFHIVKQYTQFADRSIYRHSKKEVKPGLMQDRKKYNKGTPAKLNSKGERKIIREIPRLQENLVTLLLQRESNMRQDLLMCLLELCVGV